jgi:hypothetical protein
MNQDKPQYLFFLYIACVVLPAVFTVCELRFSVAFEGQRPFGTWDISEAISAFWLLSLAIGFIAACFVSYRSRFPRWIKRLAEWFAVGLIIAFLLQCVLPVYALKLRFLFGI